MPWGVAAGALALGGAALSTFGGGGSKTEQRSEQFTGPLQGIYRDNAMAQLHRQFSGRPITSPSYTRLPYAPIEPAQLGPMGLYPGQMAGFQEAVRQATGQLSGNFGNKGFNLPRHIDAIAGSAAQNVAPQFVPLIGQQTQAYDQFRELLNRSLIDVNREQFGAESASYQNYLAAIDRLINSLGGTSMSQGGGFGLQFSPRGPTQQIDFTSIGKKYFGDTKTKPATSPGVGEPIGFEA